MKSSEMVIFKTLKMILDYVKQSVIKPVGYIITLKGTPPVIYQNNIMWTAHVPPNLYLIE